jgi:hypothetical protein
MDTRNLWAVLIGVALAAGIAMWTRGAHAQTGPDAAVIAQLKKAGSNLSKPHAIEFYLYFPVREAADRVAEKIRAAGFAAKVDRAAKGPDWIVLATKTMVPTETALASIRRDFDAWASAEKGQYDGWGTPVVK